MATTEPRTGFRLPWVADRAEPEDPTDGASAARGEATEAPVADEATVGPDEGLASAMPDPAAKVSPEAVPEPSAAQQPATPVRPAAAAPRQSSRFLADLTRAMQIAAQAAREQSLGQLQADAKTFVEQIHAQSSAEAAELRSRSEGDVAAIREWSKHEIARIREEAEQRIGDRKARLEREIEEHAARTEHEIERVQTRVGAFEVEMSGFFERLLAEPDPTRFAALAENLPEPPAFGEPEPIAETADDAPRPETETTPEPAAEAPALDPRLAALGLAPDFASAEAEAAAAAHGNHETEETGEVEEVADLEHDAITARLAGLIPSAVTPAPPVELQQTQVVVVGLVSVASIAGFKRALGRIPGVQSVGVSSGPAGDFVFNATHSPDVVLRDVVPTIPGFQARIASAGDGVVRVTAQDLES